MICRPAEDGRADEKKTSLQICMFRTGGEVHKRIRSAFDPCYSTENVAQAVDMMEQECKQYLNQMVQDKQVLI